MIWNDFHFYSNELQIQTAAYVLLPDAHVLGQQNGAPLPALYLLHGLSDDHTVWLRQTRLEQLARKSRMAIVMPAANRSFYTDMAHGGRYFSFISKELPEVMEAVFPIGKRREDRFAAGLSMGGYGAMKLGLLLPERYGAVAALSAPLGLEHSFEARTRQDEDFLHELNNIFGSEDALKAGDGNLALLADRLLQTPERLPRIYAACGTEDFLFEDNERFMRRYGEGLRAEYHTESGTHNWAFWDGQLERVLRWLNVPAAENVW